MKDPITTAFVVKGAASHPEYSMFLEFMPEGEVEAVQRLCTAADLLETEYEKFGTEEFGHLVFAYDIAEPFGALLVEQTVAQCEELEIGFIQNMAQVILTDNLEIDRRPKTERQTANGKRISMDRMCSDSVRLEFSYEAQGLAEHPMFPFSGWQAKVANGNTQEGYWEYVYNCVHHWEEPQ